MVLIPQYRTGKKSYGSIENRFSLLKVTDCFIKCDMVIVSVDGFATF